MPGRRVAAAILLVLATASAPAAQVAPDDGRFRYDGAWYAAASNGFQGVAGSRLRFRCTGSLQAQFSTPPEVQAIVRILVDHQPVYVGPCSGPLAIEATGSGSLVELGVMAAHHSGNWRIGLPPGVVWSGLVPRDGASLLPAPAPSFHRPLIWVGDSIMTGVAIHGRHGPVEARDQASLAFPWLVADRLDAASILIARSGASVRELAECWRERQPARPATASAAPLVMINAGANDIRTPVPVFQQQYQELLDAIRQCHPDATFVLLNFFRSRPNRIDTLRRLVAADREGRTHFLDVHRHITGYADRGVHPDQASHAALALALEDWILHAGPPP